MGATTMSTRFDCSVIRSRRSAGLVSNAKAPPATMPTTTALTTGGSAMFSASRNVRRCCSTAATASAHGKTGEMIPSLYPASTLSRFRTRSGDQRLSHTAGSFHCATEASMSATADMGDPPTS